LGSADVPDVAMICRPERISLPTIRYASGEPRPLRTTRALVRSDKASPSAHQIIGNDTHLNSALHRRHHPDQCLERDTIEPAALGGTETRGRLVRADRQLRERPPRADARQLGSELPLQLRHWIVVAHA